MGGLVELAAKSQPMPVNDQQQHPVVINEHDLQRYKLIIAYDGTRYKGYQRQSSSTTPPLAAAAGVAATTDNDNHDTSSSNNNDNKKKKHKKDHNNIPLARQLKKRKHDEVSGEVKVVPLTVQESLEDALEHYTTLHRYLLRVRSAGRTDAGVHARGQVVAVSLPKNIINHGNDNSTTVVITNNNKNNNNYGKFVKLLIQDYLLILVLKMYRHVLNLLIQDMML